MKKNNIEIISDDCFLTNGILALTDLTKFKTAVLIIDIDRINSIMALERYLSQTEESTIIIGISRKGLISKLFDPMSLVTIEEPLAEVEKKLANPLQATSIKSVWLSHCREIRTGKLLSQPQKQILYYVRRGLSLHKISCITGRNPKTCYSHIRSITFKLNLKNFNQLRQFSSLL